METHTGLLTHVKVFKEGNYPITGILMFENDECINCVIKDRYLSKYVLSLPMHKYHLEVQGRYNERGQFNIKKMRIINIDSYIAIIGTPE